MGLNIRAENGIRTRDPDLGKVVLYQLSYFRMTSKRSAKITIFSKSTRVMEILFLVNKFRLFNLLYIQLTHYQFANIHYFHRGIFLEGLFA
jgi:hypothetical protein